MKKLILLLLGICILLFLVFFKLDIPRFMSIISQRLSWTFYGAISFAIVLQLLIRSIRFKFLHKSIIGNPITALNAFMLTSSSFFIALATPSKIGDISRGFYAKDNKMEITAISIIEYLLDILIVVLIPALSIFLLYENYASSIMLLYGVIALGIVSLYLLKKIFPSKALSSRFSLIRNILEKLKSVQGIMRKSLSAKLALSGGFILTCLFYGIYFVIFYAVLHRLGENLTFFEVVFAAGTGVFLGTLSFIPMGLGARDASMYGIIVSLGVDTDLALSAVLIMRSLSLSLLLVSSCCYFITISKADVLPGNNTQ